MKMKRILALLLVIVMCFTLTACHKDTGSKPSSAGESTAASQSDQASPLLYRVTDKSGNVIWLFGSIHVGRESYYPLPDYVQNAFKSSDSLAVELDIVAAEKNLKLQMEAIAPLIYYDGSTIEDHIPKSLYTRAVKALKKYNSYTSVMDLYRPALWASMIESLMIKELGGDPELGIDNHMINMAYEAEKEIVEIESAKFQYQMLADFSDDIQLMLLASAVLSSENTEKATSEVNELMDLWASGDEKAFEEYLNSTDNTLTKKQKQLYEEYQQILVTDRNIGMADFAQEALSSGKETFICVGAAHIVGDGAVADLLAERGYTVELITK